MAFLLDTQLPLTALEASRKNLVISIVEEYHGPIVATVAEVLMRAERTTLAELNRLVQRDQGIMGVSRAGRSKPKVTSANVKESLLILTQHNAVNVTMPTERELRRATISAHPRGNNNIRLHYTLSPLQVLVRTRGPHFQSHATRKLGRAAGMIVDSLLRNGRMTLPEVKDEVMRRQREDPAMDASEDINEAAVTPESIQDSFERLVMRRYIDKVPKLDLATPSSEPETVKKPSMVFAKDVSRGKSPKHDKAAEKAGKSQLAERQNKSASQANARKRRMLGTGSSGGSGPNSSDDEDDDDHLPVEMRAMVASMGPESGDGPPAKRRKGVNGDRSSGEGQEMGKLRKTGRSRGRGNRGGRGRPPPRRQDSTAGQGVEELDMEGVFDSQGDRDEGEAQSVFLPRRGKAGGAATVLDSVVWRLGVDQFHREFRRAALLELVHDRFPRSKLAYLMAKVMLDDSAPREREVKEDVTAAISASTLYTRLCDEWTSDPKTRNKPKPDWGRTITWMTALCTDLTEMASKIPGTDGQDAKYVLNMGKMIQYLQTKLVRSTIRDHYGKETARIMEILLQHKFLEQQQVGEMAMIPASDARERLYQLLKARLVSMQEVPKRGDHNPNTTFYLWTIKHDQLHQVLLDKLYKAMLNMRLRRKYVYGKEKELFIHDAAARLSNEGEREHLEEVRRSLDRLDTALLRLDEHLMHFNTF